MDFKKELAFEQKLHNDIISLIKSHVAKEKSASVEDQRFTAFFFLKEYIKQAKNSYRKFESDYSLSDDEFMSMMDYMEMLERIDNSISNYFKNNIT